MCQCGPDVFTTKHAQSITITGVRAGLTPSRFIVSGAERDPAGPTRRHDLDDHQPPVTSRLGWNHQTRPAADCKAIIVAQRQLLHRRPGWLKARSGLVAEAATGPPLVSSQPLPSEGFEAGGPNYRNTLAGTGPGLTVAVSRPGAAVCRPARGPAESSTRDDERWVNDPQPGSAGYIPCR